MTEFTKGSEVSFRRNHLINEASSVVVSNHKEDRHKPCVVVIESDTFGWVPSASRIALFGLDPAKKYLFCSEDELTLL